MSLSDFLRARLSTSTSAQLTAPHLRTTLWLLLALLWLPVLAIAAPAAAGGSLDLAVRVSPALIAVSVLLSSLSGATALVIRIDRELSAAPDKP
ncbi:hypothetical protein, partial [uncultured Xylophilus sp.]|uniref:hypothetical protein n=1 Tax=uncultured Xylophilus sp. TaxID=296832 RepID=UPI0025D245CC